MKLDKIWSLILVVLGFAFLLGLVAGILDWSIKQYAYIPYSILGMLMVCKILKWDWDEKKKDSTDQSFKLRK